MYDPRPVRLHVIASLVDLPSGNVRSPRAPAFTTKIGRSGPRPLTTANMSSEKTGVGAVIFELPTSRHNSFPVRGSQPRMKLDAFATRTGPTDVIATVGVPHDGSSSRSVFHTVLPVSASRAKMNESLWVSHCRMTRLFQMIGGLAGPHSYVGMSYAPRSSRPSSTF